LIAKVSGEVKHTDDSLCLIEEEKTNDISIESFTLSVKAIHYEIMVCRIGNKQGLVQARIELDIKTTTCNAIFLP
jgi:hypothetical protein